MTKRDSFELSEGEQLLLSQYFDGECGFFARRRAEKLLQRSGAARDFLEALQEMSSECRSFAAENAPSADLWQRIESRIDSEERAAFYLGERRKDDRRESFFSRLRSQQAVWGGLSGAVVAASALFFVTSPGSKAAPVPAQPFHQAAIGGMAASPASFQNNSRSAMEVDWMRANGSLKLIQDPSGKSATIWVRRRPGSVRTLNAARATPPSMATPHLYLDGQRR